MTNDLLKSTFDDDALKMKIIKCSFNFHLL